MPATARCWSARRSRCPAVPRPRPRNLDEPARRVARGLALVAAALFVLAAGARAAGPPPVTLQPLRASPRAATAPPPAAAPADPRAARLAEFVTRMRARAMATASVAGGGGG